MVKSPLILGNDITDMVKQSLVITRKTCKLTLAFQSDETKTILMNDAIIAVSQDPSGGPASQIWKKPIDGGELQLWTGSLSRRSARESILLPIPGNEVADTLPVHSPVV